MIIVDRLKGKVAIITGGTSGIGQGIAECFVREGAKVVITGRHVPTTPNDNVTFMQQDISLEEDWLRVIKETVEKFGQLDIVVNNAGIAPKYESIDKLSLADWQKVIDVDLTGTFLGIKHAMAEMVKEKHAGSIINIASIASFIGGAKSSSYGAAKGGVRLLTKCAAIDGTAYQPTIRVNSVHLGAIRTNILTSDQVKAFGEQTPIGHIGEPSDIGELCVYLGSDESKFVTVSNFIIDGGWTAI